MLIDLDRLAMSMVIAVGHIHVGLYSATHQKGTFFIIILTGWRQARVSNDYQPGNEQWKIGISSMFAHALGVAPFKDNFWTTTNQPGNPYSKYTAFRDAPAQRWWVPDR